MAAVAAASDSVVSAEAHSAEVAALPEERRATLILMERAYYKKDECEIEEDEERED